MKNDLDNTGAYSSPVHPADILAIPEYTWPVGLMHLYPALSGPLFHPKILLPVTSLAFLLSLLKYYLRRERSYLKSASYVTDRSIHSNSFKDQSIKNWNYISSPLVIPYAYLLPHFSSQSMGLP